ncbi:hypothetical protein MesoLj131c_65790 (plasmid) [Mesorhizobium sp. 131-3-5]|uniref:aldehyde dehydrogenase family protein n=1 Tax=Mesorhizobium sp. 131-3-5 TaxID=2744520 RepID=UPI0018EC1472|nr:aldehyde dehydrogenase family protein [Mesorhizobium sp. 131-3-5]BCH12321.1 hypothetical protein MesoLj131c_65790 [Mesorhizobium sp. 131-3-5]
MTVPDIELAKRAASEIAEHTQATKWSETQRRWLAQCDGDGEWEGKHELPMLNHSTNEEISKVSDFSKAETAKAIDAAKRAFLAWAGLLAKERSTILRRWHDFVLKHAGALARILTSEQGKPKKQSSSRAGPFPDVEDGRTVVIRQPAGVVATITPSVMITLVRRSGLAARPSSNRRWKTAHSMLLAALGQEAALPPRFVNVVTRRARAIANAISTPDVYVRVLYYLIW